MAGVYPKLNTRQTQVGLAVEQAMGPGLMNPLEVAPVAEAAEEHGLIHPCRQGMLFQATTGLIDGMRRSRRQGIE